MTYQVLHTKVALTPDDPLFEVGSNEWNQAHTTSMTSGTILGRLSAGIGLVEELSPAQVTAQLGVFTATLQGLVPASGGGTANFLRADNTWAPPPGGVPGGSSGQVQYNNAGAFGGFTVGGDATLVTSTGVLTITNQAVTYGKIQNISATSRFLGRISAGAGITEELTAANAWTVLGVMPAANEPAHTGDVTNPAGSLALTIGNATVTYAKMQNISAASLLLGRGSAAGAGSPQEITLGTNLSMSGATLNATGGGVPAGSSGQFQYNNAGAFGATNVWRESADITAFRNSTTPEGIYVYNTFTNSSNYERGVLDWTTSANFLIIGTQNAGTGAFRQMELTASNIYYTGANHFIRTTGGVSIWSHTPTGSGYPNGVGLGSAVTQATSKSTGVTLNNTSGQITMNNASLAAGAIVSFVLTNSNIGNTDMLIMNHISGGTPGSYLLNAQCAAGSATINVRNTTAGALAETIVIQYGILKGANS